MQDDVILKTHITSDKVFVLLLLYSISMNTPLDITDIDVAVYGNVSNPLSSI